MSLDELRALLLQHCVKIGDEEIDETNQDQHAERVDLAIQWVVQDFCNAYSWSWRHATDTCTAASDGTAPLPYNFGTFGAHGSVSMNSARHVLIPLPEQQFFALRTREGGTASRPTYYTLAGMDGGRTLRVHKPPASTVNLDLVYCWRPPLLDISGGEDDLDLIPAEYHAGLLYDGAAARLLFSEGDPRSVEVGQQYERAKARAWTNDHMYHWPRKRPRFGSRMGVYR